MSQVKGTQRTRLRESRMESLTESSPSARRMTSYINTGRNAFWSHSLRGVKTEAPSPRYSLFWSQESGSTSAQARERATNLAEHNACHWNRARAILNPNARFWNSESCSRNHYPLTPLVQKYGHQTASSGKTPENSSGSTTCWLLALSF